MKTKAEKHLILKKSVCTTLRLNDFIVTKKVLTYFQLKFNPRKPDWSRRSNTYRNEEGHNKNLIQVSLVFI